MMMPQEVKMYKKLLQSKRSGFALALVLTAVILLLVIGVGLLSIGTQERLMGVRTSSEIAARNAADTGLTKALFTMNRMLDKKTFIAYMLNQKTLRPPYFSKMEELNLEGPPLPIDSASSKRLRVDEFEKEMKESHTVIVDTRKPDAFAGSHIPGSLNIWLDGLSVFPGWVLTYDQRILLVTDRKEDVKTAEAYLWRLGFDHIAGYLCPGIGEWRNRGRPVEQLGTLSAAMLNEKLNREDIVLIDVREPSEWQEGYIKGAEQIYVGHLMEESTRLPRDKPIACACSVGYRGGLGASILKKMGFREVHNVLGGMRAWKALGYPVEKK